MGDEFGAVGTSCSNTCTLDFNCFSKVVTKLVGEILWMSFSRLRIAPTFQIFQSVNCLQCSSGIWDIRPLHFSQIWEIMATSRPTEERVSLLPVNYTDVFNDLNEELIIQTSFTLHANIYNLLNQKLDQSYFGKSFQISSLNRWC